MGRRVCRYDDYAAFKVGVKELELMMATAMRTALNEAPGLQLQLETLAVSRPRTHVMMKFD